MKTEETVESISISRAVNTIIAQTGATFDISTATWSIGDAESNLCSWNGMVLSVKNNANIIITGTGPSRRRVMVYGTARVTLDNANIFSDEYGFAPLAVGGCGTLYLMLKGRSTLTATHHAPGLSVPSGSSLVIYGHGRLYSTGHKRGAGIGGGGSVTINSGKITATGGAIGSGIGANGIGMGNYGRTGAIVINGGIVNAIGGLGGAGIGGAYGSGSIKVRDSVVINGGVVTAEGCYGGANDTGSYGSPGSAGIGTGGFVGGGNLSIIINGGTVVATSGGRADDIGLGGAGGRVTVVVNGGSVTGTHGKIRLPRNGAGLFVHSNTLKVGDVAKGTMITAGSIDGVACAEMPDASVGVYGLKNVRTDAESNVYFWLPASEGNNIVALNADNDKTYFNDYERTGTTINATLREASHLKALEISGVMRHP